MSSQAVEYRCPNCQTAIDVEAEMYGEDVACPNPDCGRRMHIEPPAAEQIPVAPKSSGDLDANGVGEHEETLMTLHPAMLRPHPFVGLAVLAALACGVAGLVRWATSNRGVVVEGNEWLSRSMLLPVSLSLTLVAAAILFGWWVRTQFTTLSITTERSIMRKGILSRYTSEVRHRDVRNLQIEQNILERIVGVGDVAISSAGQDDMEIDVHGLPHPEEVASAVREMQSVKKID